ncbi:MAG: hypothetical protein AB7I30_23880, partial [Isosphaeraceae bacterium]
PLPGSPSKRHVRQALTTLLAGFMAFLGACSPQPSRGAWIWVEGEKPFASRVHRHPYWYDKVKRDALSGGDFLSNWHANFAGEASYRVLAPTAGDYEFWVRANTLQARLSYKLNDAPWTEIDLDKDPRQSANVAEDGKPDLRFLAWVKVGGVPLKKGANVVRFRFHSENNNHGYLDCFVFSDEPFTPKGALRPDQVAFAKKKLEAQNRGWFAFDPGSDPYSSGNPIDLRSLNENQAGDGGFIAAREGRFVHADSGQPVRFWAVNGPAGKDPESLRREARLLAKRGVNLVRVHHAYTNELGDFDPEAVTQAIDVVAAMKAEGIYTHFSIYFPIWLKPAPGTKWLEGYDGQKHPFAALMFNKDFQEVYRGWWKALLTTPHPTSGNRLIDDPAVLGVEIQNEDSFFFWTFDPASIPDPQLRIIESRFHDWIKRRYGSVDVAVRRWNGMRLDRDRPAAGRLAMRPLWNMANEKTPRDKDNAQFLAETQRDFYRDTYRFLKLLGFKGVVTASNWTTANAEILGPIEKYTYTVTDFIDRHGYFGSNHKGDQAAWSIRDGHTFSDRSALRFEAEAPGGPRLFAHPAIDVTYEGKPSMISETTWNRPNRYRSEAPLYYAAYGALQGTDAVVHFAFDGANWAVKPNYYMQPWTLSSPAMLGQFPAAALIFRKGLIDEGDVLAEINLRPSALFDLQGTPLPQDAALDELRLKDVPPAGQPPRAGQVIDPLIHYAGRTNVRFQENGGPNRLKDLRPFINRTAKTVTSTHGQVRLDYGKGLLAIDAPMAQGYSGDLRDIGSVLLQQMVVESPLDQMHVVAVSLDDQPIASSKRILLQVMTEEAAAGFRTEPMPDGTRKILSIGTDPWMVRQIEGIVR